MNRIISTLGPGLFDFCVESSRISLVGFGANFLGPNLLEGGEGVVSLCPTKVCISKRLYGQLIKNESRSKRILFDFYLSPQIHYFHLKLIFKTILVQSTVLKHEWSLYGLCAMKINLRSRCPRKCELVVMQTMVQIYLLTVISVDFKC